MYEHELFVFVLQFYNPINPSKVISSAASLPNHTFPGRLSCAHSFARNNCPS